VNNSDSWPPAWLTSDPNAEISGEGDLVVDFAETFGIVTKDSVAGKAGDPLVLRDWQKALVRAIFQYDEAGEGLKHRVNLIGMPRKSGKSALGSVLALYSLIVGPKGGEVYSVAAEKEQARIVFADAKRTVEASEELTALTRLYRDAIEMPELGSVYRVLSAEAYSKEGLNPHFILFDELHAQPNRELFDVMSLAMGARGKLATLVAITTAGQKSDSTGRDSIAYSLYNYGKAVSRGEIDDPSFFVAWWEADGDFRSEETWRIATRDTEISLIRPTSFPLSGELPRRSSGRNVVTNESRLNSRGSRTVRGKRARRTSSRIRTTRSSSASTDLSPETPPLSSGASSRRRRTIRPGCFLSKLGRRISRRTATIGGSTLPTSRTLSSLSVKSSRRFERSRATRTGGRDLCKCSRIRDSRSSSGRRALRREWSRLARSSTTRWSRKDSNTTAIQLSRATSTTLSSRTTVSDQGL